MSAGDFVGRRRSVPIGPERDLRVTIRDGDQLVWSAWLHPWVDYRLAIYRSLGPYEPWDSPLLTSIRRSLLPWEWPLTRHGAVATDGTPWGPEGRL